MAPLNVILALTSQQETSLIMNKDSNTKSPATAPTTQGSTVTIEKPGVIYGGASLVNDDLFEEAYDEEHGSSNEMYED